LEDSSNIDAIVESVEQSTNNEIPMESTPNEMVPPVVEQAPQEFEFTAEGRTYKGDIEKLKRWAQMGVTAPNKFGELSKKLSDYEGRFKQYEQYDNVYKPIDEWARANPDKWNSLLQSWQQAQFGVQPPQPGQQGQTPQLPPELIQKIQGLEQFKTSFEKQQETQRIQAADQSLDGEIGEIRKQFSHIDFDAPDESGLSLEYQVLKHATDNGIPSFRAAFRDYAFDRLTKMSESKGRQGAGVSPQTKAALLGKNPTAARGQNTPDLKGKNYDQIHSMILQEFGIG
jgi:hypothetical protein